MGKPPLIFTFYIAAPIEKVWDGRVVSDSALDSPGCYMDLFMQAPIIWAASTPIS